MEKSCIVLLRHAERLDRAMEAQGLDWIHSAPFPQDPPLSDIGCHQAHEVGLTLKHFNLTHIYASPMIRTVMTGDIVSKQLASPLPLWIETGLIEEAKSFRGREQDEPKPVWIGDRLHQSPQSLKDNYSDLVDLTFHPLQEVTHSPAENTIRNRIRENGIRENHETILDVGSITRDRCSQFISKLLTRHQGDADGFRVLCIGHGASCSGCAHALEKDLPDNLKIQGERLVSSWARYIPFDETNLNGPWYCPEGVWQNVSLPIGESVAAENVADRGIDP
jgi:broad specificity phosphatase PhoE